MVRLLGLALALALLAGCSQAAGAQRRAYAIVGGDSGFERLRYGGSPFASDVTRHVRALTLLADGRIVLVTDGGGLSVVDGLGRIVDVARLPNPHRSSLSATTGYDLELERSGTLLAVVGGRLFRVAPDWSYTELRPAGTSVARGVDPLEDGGFLLAARHRVVRVSPGGAVEPLAGSGSGGRAREGAALTSPAGAPMDVVRMTDGALAFTDVGSHSVMEVRDGEVRRLAGGGRRAAWELPPAGWPARSVRLSLWEGNRLHLLADGTLAVSTDAGLRAVAAGRVTELVRGGVDSPRGFPPVWAGERVGRAWVVEPSGFAVAPGGEWIIGGSGGLVLVTRPEGGSTRLAAAVLSSTQRAVWRRRVDVSLTRPAEVTVRVRSRGRVLATVKRTVQAGRSTLRLPRALPDRVSRVELQARAPDGAFASHRRNVLGRPRLPLAVARRALGAYRYPGGDAYSELSRCRRLGPRRIRCRQVTGGDGTVDRDETVTATLRRDGWIEARSASGRARLEVPPGPSRRSRAPDPAPS